MLALKPDGRFAFQEMVAGAGPVTYFPLPWATDAAENFLISLEETRALLAQCGLVADDFEDVSNAQLPPPAEGTPDSAAQAPLSLSVYVDDPATSNCRDAYPATIARVRSDPEIIIGLDPDLVCVAGFTPPESLL